MDMNQLVWERTKRYWAVWRSATTKQSGWTCYKTADDKTFATSSLELSSFALTWQIRFSTRNFILIKQTVVVVILTSKLVKQWLLSCSFHKAFRGWYCPNKCLMSARLLFPYQSITYASFVDKKSLKQNHIDRSVGIRYDSKLTETVMGSWSATKAESLYWHDNQQLISLTRSQSLTSVS